MMNMIKKAAGYVGTVITIIVIIVGLCSITNYIVGMIKGEDNPGYVEPNEEYHDIQLTTYDIKSELSEISELMTYEYTYTGTASITDYRETPLLGWNIPLTGHEIKMTYAGTIKVGYELKDMEIDVDNNRKVITVSLGAQVVDNNLPEESVETIEKNNLANPIRSDEVTNRLAEIKEQEYAEAIEKGIEEKAEENAKAVITEKLSDIEGYEVRFI